MNYLKAVPKPSKKKKKLLPLASLRKKADKVFSKFIRNRDAVELQGRCCTCGQPGNQAGHFIKRGHLSVRYHPQNVHLQCCRCNHFLDGNDSEYSRFIINKYGMDIFNWLLEQKKIVRKLTREELNQIIEAYK